MSQAIRELLLNDEMRARMGKGARSRAAEEFSYERFRGQIAKILEEFRSGGSTFLN
jgi:glycosyltransferase involved in cell wall biosynthesis